MRSKCIKESYTKDESVKEEPGDDEAEGEVNGDDEMPSDLLAIVAPDRFHVRPRTTIGVTRIKQLLGHQKRLKMLQNQQTKRENCPRLSSIRQHSERSKKFALILLSEKKKKREKKKELWSLGFERQWEKENENEILGGDVLYKYILII